jgi:DNA-binding GntR family transcriptional regulator
MARLTQSVFELPPPPPAAQGDASARLGERCAAYLRGLLLDGGLDPGDPVSIEAVARAVGASRQPAMDAVKRLAAEGFITILPQIGCRVVRAEPEHVEDFYALFSASEGLLAKMAAERRTADEALALQDSVNLMWKAIDEGGPIQPGDPAHRLLNRRHHEALHMLARSPIVARISAGMWDRCDFYVRIAFGSLALTERVRRAHVAIKDAILSGDGVRAERETIAYLWPLGQNVVRSLRRQLSAADAVR